jgi:hypothetical protein
VAGLRKVHPPGAFPYTAYLEAEIALTAPVLHCAQTPAHRLGREKVVPQVRYRVAQEGWGRVAEIAAKYNVNCEDVNQ